MTLNEKWQPKVDLKSLSDDYTDDELRKAIYKTLDQFVGQEEIIEEVKRTIFEKPPSECPNFYFRGMNGVGKTTLIEIILVWVARSRGNVLHINSADEGLIGVMRGPVKEAAKHATLEEGEKVIWFQEAYLMTPKAIEALKVLMDDYTSTVWVFDSNRRMDIGLDRRCVTFDFLPISDESIHIRISHIRTEEGLTHIPLERLDTIVMRANGNLAEAINMLLAPPVKSLTKELFMSAAQNYDIAYESYSRARPNAMDFMEEAAVLVAKSTKMDFPFKRTIVRQIGQHYHWLMNSVPDTIVMGSILSFVHDEFTLMSKRMEEKPQPKERKTEPVP